MEKGHSYSEGDWIVHSQHGIGQVKGVDEKDISGEKTRYYRIKTTDSTFWMPINQMDHDVLRSVSTLEEIQQAIVTLQKPAEEMSSNYKIRQQRIQRALVLNTPEAIAQLIRDLRAQQRKTGGLNTAERNAFRSLKQRLVEEWAIVKGINADTAASKLDNILNP